MGLDYRERFKNKKKYIDKEEFLKANYIKCKYCGYNNERKRNLQFGVCLNCGKILDQKTYFMIKMNEMIKNNRRKSR